MARAGRGQDRRGRSDTDPAFCQWPWWLMESPAFHALSPDAKTALLYLTKRFNGRNNGQIVFGVRSGSRVRNPGQPDSETKDRPIMSKTKLTNALNQIEALRLAEISKASTFGQKKLAREWRLAWLPCNGKAPGREFMALSESDCASILAGINSKARPAGRTDGTGTGPPAGQSPPLSTVNMPVQARPQAYDASPQARPQATSSNHPYGVQKGAPVAA